MPIENENLSQLSLRNLFQNYLTSKADPVFGLKPDNLDKSFKSLLELVRLARIDLKSVFRAVESEMQNLASKALTPSAIVLKAQEIWSKENYVKIDGELTCDQCLNTGIVSFLKSDPGEGYGCAYSFRCKCKYGDQLSKEIPLMRERPPKGFIEYDLFHMSKMRAQNKPLHE